MPALAAAMAASKPARPLTRPHPPPPAFLQLLASLSSPHIVRYYDSFLHDGKLHIVMEYAPGGSLHAAITRSPRPLPEDAIWRVLLHTALALHHMHSRWVQPSAWQVLPPSADATVPPTAPAIPNKPPAAAAAAAATVPAPLLQAHAAPRRQVPQHLPGGAAGPERAAPAVQAGRRRGQQGKLVSAPPAGQSAWRQAVAAG